jgi:hypothetical protein
MSIRVSRVALFQSELFQQSNKAMLNESAFEANLLAQRQQAQDDSTLPVDFKCVLVGDSGIGKVRF